MELVEPSLEPPLAASGPSLVLAVELSVELFGPASSVAVAFVAVAVLLAVLACSVSQDDYHN